MAAPEVDIGNADLIAAVFPTHRITRLAIFGPALHGNRDEESDLDILVEFEPGLSFFDIEQQLSDLHGEAIALNTPDYLSNSFRNEVLTEALDLYVA